MSDKEIVAQKVWKLFDVLRSGFYAEDYHVVLLFIYLRSENQLFQQLHHAHQPKFELVEVLERANDATLQKIFDVFLPSVKRQNEQSIRKVIDLLASIDSEWFQQNIDTLFDDILERIALSQGKKNAPLIQPKQLTEFINAYVGSTKGLKVFNPFAKAASFIKSMKDTNSVYAQELNQKTWAIGQLRLIVHRSTADFRCEDSIANWPTYENYDLILSYPPLGQRLNPKYKNLYTGFRTTEEFLLGMGIQSLTSRGKLIAVLYQGILFRGGSEQRLREQLVQKDLIDTIISFPGGILHNTGIPFVVLVLNKAKDIQGAIKLVQADAYVSNPSPRKYHIDVEKLLQASRSVENSDSVRIVSNEAVIANDFNLNIPRYFQEEVEGVKLKELLTYYRGNIKELPEHGKGVRIRDLSDDPIDFHLDLSLLERMPLKKMTFRKIEASCLLLASRGEKLKPTYFDYNGEAVYNSSGIFAFEIDDSKVDIAYLVNELHADYVLKQIEGFGHGTTIRFFRKDDLLEVKIKLPSLEEQRAKVAGLKEISDRIKELEIERNAIIHGVSSKEFNEFASLKHTLGTPRQNILGWSKNLSNFFVQEKEAISRLNDEFKEIFNLGIIEAIAEINRDIKFISDVLEKGEKGLVLSEYEKEIVPLVEVNNLINALSNNEFKFSIKKQLLKVDEMKTRGILINKLLFKALLDNILTNANKYGFKDKSKGNHVMIEATDINNQLILEVRNNGLPFPKNFDREKFITKYSTADSSNGSGLGGYDINRIAAYFENENWDLILNSDPIYPVIFRFSFPIKLIK